VGRRVWFLSFANTGSLLDAGFSPRGLVSIPEHTMCDLWWRK
jgi:hypothetical protein